MRTLHKKIIMLDKPKYAKERVKKRDFGCVMQPK
jgi:hypothetical protein